MVSTKRLSKTLVIVGPTAAGKSDLAILLARKYNGEIISADSRQVYLGMDIGTGKVIRDKIVDHPTVTASHFYSEGIRHHLLDVANPKRSYNVTHFVRDAKKALMDIKKRGKTSIICGGTGFWVQSLLEDSSFPAVKPDAELRKKLVKLSTAQLFARLKKQDPRRAKNIDPKNKVRLIRALEIIATLGKVPPLSNSEFKIQDTYLIIALNPDKETVHKNIAIRLKKRLQKGMVKEVKRLRKEGLSWKKLESFGLEYKYIALYLQKILSREEMLTNIELEIRHFAKRQLTWLNRMEKQGWKMHWISNAKEVRTLLP